MLNYSLLKNRHNKTKRFNLKRTVEIFNILNYSITFDFVKKMRFESNNIEINPANLIVSFVINVVFY